MVAGVCGNSRRDANRLRDIRERKQATVTSQLGAGEREPSRAANQGATRTQLLVRSCRRYVRGREGDGDRLFSTRQMRHDREVCGDIEDGSDDAAVKCVDCVERIGARREANAPATVDAIHKRRFEEPQERHFECASAAPVDLIGRYLDRRGHFCILEFWVGHSRTPDQVIAYIGGRGEQEIVIDPRHSRGCATTGRKPPG